MTKDADYTEHPTRTDYVFRVVGGGRKLTSRHVQDLSAS